MSTTPIVSYLDRMIKSNNVKAVKSLLATRKFFVRVPLYMIFYPILKGHKQMLFFLFKHTNFRPRVHKINFERLVDKILDQDDRELFEMVMDHFEPVLYRLLVSFGRNVDPFDFYSALKFKANKYTRWALIRMCLSELVYLNSISRYKRIDRILKRESHLGYKFLCRVVIDSFHIARKRYNILFLPKL